VSSIPENFEIVIAPAKIGKQGKRFYVEIPAGYNDIAQVLHGIPLRVTLAAIPNAKTVREMFGSNFEAEGVQRAVKTKDKPAT
jgi:hypothetical protein